MTGFNYQFIGKMSSVTGIVDRGGGIRVVVTYPELLRHHVSPGERAFTVPGLWMQEPVEWASNTTYVIKAATDYAFEQLAKEKRHGC